VSPLGLSLLLVILVVPAMMEAQTASITGTLTDAIGAVVQAAKVTARNTQTNASRSTQTGDTGVYRVTNLLPGVYEVLFEKQSFQTLRFSNVNVRRVNRIRIEVSYEHGRSNQL